ncbi:MAG: hypothetical protein A2X36_10350 [Elusimicrobia bacterium GWA2_69_24]|nr:MAG: hypothetical protein A2X36_10350 [Elusimicrobia bacterium GWA2_69_24]
MIRDYIPGWRSVTKTSLLFMAVALSVAFYLRTYDSATVKIIILELGTLVAFGAWLLGSLREGRFELPVPALTIMLPAGALILWHSLLFVLNPYHLARLTDFVQQLCFLLAAFLGAAVFTRKDLRVAVAAVVGGWTVVVLYALLQHFGFDPFIWKGAFGERVFSTLGNPTFLTAYILIAAPLALGWCCDESIPGWAQANCAIVAFSSCVVLCWTGTHRTALLILPILGIFAFFAYRFLAEDKRLAALTLAGACAAGFIITRAMVPAEQTNYRWGPGFSVETWKGTLSLIKNQPFVGSGPGSFWIRYPAFRRPEIILMEHQHNTETDHPENEFLEHWVEGGMLSTVLWMLLFASALRLCLRSLREDPGYAAAFLAAVAGAAAASLFTISSRFAAPGWSMYFAVGLTAALARRGPEDSVIAIPVPFEAPRRLAAVAIIAAGLWAGWQSVRHFRADVSHNIAIFWAKQKEWDKAFEQFDRIPPGAPAYIMAQYFKGNVLLDRGGPGDLEAAVAQYRLVRGLAPDYVQVHFQEGSALEKLGRIPEAVERLERQAQLDPVWDTGWTKLAGLYRKAGRREDALAAEAKAAEAKERWGTAGDIPKPVMGNLKEYGGTGVQLLFEHGETIVSEVYKNGPAYQAGIRPGDRILELGEANQIVPLLSEGKPVKLRMRELTAKEVAEKLIGEPGTEVSVAVLPNGKGTKVRVLTLKRAAVHFIPSSQSREDALRTIAASAHF